MEKGIGMTLHPWRGIRPWTRHSLVLLVSGLAYAAVGLSYIFTEPSRAREHALVVALDWAPLNFWGFVFVFAGLVSIISSRWPPISETWGYMVLAGLSGGWGGVYLTGVLLKHSPVSNLSGFFAWMLFAFLWWAVSGLLNPKQVIIIRR